MIDQWQANQEIFQAQTVAAAQVNSDMQQNADDNPDVPTTTLQDVANSMSGNSATFLTNNDDGTFSETTVDGVVSLGTISGDVEDEVDDDPTQRYAVHFTARVAQDEFNRIIYLYAATTSVENGNWQTVNQHGISSVIVSSTGTWVEYLTPLPAYEVTIF